MPTIQDNLPKAKFGGIRVQATHGKNPICIDCLVERERAKNNPRGFRPTSWVASTETIKCTKCKQDCVATDPDVR